MICHNPGIAAFAARIVVDPPDHPKSQTYPTAATAILSFEAESWSQVGWGEGTVVDFAVPRELLE